MIIAAEVGISHLFISPIGTCSTTMRARNSIHPTRIPTRVQAWGNSHPTDARSVSAIPLSRRWKDDAYAWLEPGNLDQLAQAVWLFNTIGLGVLLPSSAQDQFDRGQTWTVVRGEKGQDDHYVPIIGRNSHGNFLLVTWGRLHDATPQWVESYMDEGVQFISTNRAS